MAQESVNLIMFQGATWSPMFQWFNADGAPIDISAYTGRMQLRRTFSDVSPAFEITTANGRMTLDAQGRVNITVSATDTASLSGEYIFDCELVNGSNVTRLVQGTITVDPEVTR